MAGYLVVTLDNFGKRKNHLVNLLVATYFVTKPLNEENKPLVADHINGIKTDNGAENLQWITKKENIEKWWKQRNYINKVEQYSRKDILKVWNSMREIIDTLKYSDKRISDCCLGRKKTYKNFRWKYQNQERTRTQPKISDEEIKKDYVEIGIIKGWDFSGNYIHKDGSKIVGKSKKMITINFRNGYGEVHLKDKQGKTHSLFLHKIGNQVLKGGKYEEEVDHLNRDKKDNEKGNLESVTHRENVVRAMGKSVKQVDIETGQVIETFRTVTDAYRKLGKKNMEEE
jgi:hypothetical protein